MHPFKLYIQILFFFSLSLFFSVSFFSLYSDLSSQFGFNFFSPPNSLYLHGHHPTYHSSTCPRYLTTYTSTYFYIFLSFLSPFTLLTLFHSSLTRPLSHSPPPFILQRGYPVRHKVTLATSNSRKCLPCWFISRNTTWLHPIVPRHLTFQTLVEKQVW